MDVGTVRQRDINEEIQEAYLDYAMSVIVSRALPDARDGLKPVHRRILYAMYDMGLRPNSSYKKSARIVGEVLGKYHPHGDVAVYEAMVRMAQDFSMRYELVDGQGNFGSIDGDGAAAMRYTEARMAGLGTDLLDDIEKQTVDFTENFDGSLNEPSVLPATFPNLLVNGASGIAVGMSTSIPPHNLGEVCDALVFMLNNWNNLDDIGVPELMEYIKGPDFPTGGVVYTQDNGNDEDLLRAAYATGRGKIKLRAKVHIEDLGRGRSRLVVSEIPYQTNKTNLIERIADLTRSGKIEGITDLRDESDRNGLRIIIDVSRTVDVMDVLADLFKYTPLQTTFSIIMLALVNNEPRRLSLKQALKVYLDHRLDIIRRRSEHDLVRAEERAHILEGLLIALDNLDEVIEIIRRSRTAETAHNNLVRAFKLSEEQASAILSMQLRRLAALERRLIEDEHKEKMALIKMLTALLDNPLMMRMEIARELGEIRDKYNDARRTVIVSDSMGDVKEADFFGPNEDTWVTLTEKGLLSRTYEDNPPRITGDLDDPPLAVLASNTTHTLYLLTDKGQAATVPAKMLQQSEDPLQGAPYSTFVSLPEDETLTAMISVPPQLEEGYLVAISELGEVKRMRIEDLPGMTAHAFKFMDVEQGDRLIWIGHVYDHDEVMLATYCGQAIRFPVDNVRPTGLGAGGMRAVKLKDKQDRVVGAGIADEEGNFWVCTDNGVAKSTPVSEYPVQGRGGQGVITIKMPPDAGGLTAATIGWPDDNIIVVSNRGKAKYMRVSLAPEAGRNTKGDLIIAMTRKNESVSRVVKLESRIMVPDPVNGGSKTGEIDDFDDIDDIDIVEDIPEDDE